MIPLVRIGSNSAVMRRYEFYFKLSELKASSQPGCRNVSSFTPKHKLCQLIASMPHFCVKLSKLGVNPLTIVGIQQFAESLERSTVSGLEVLDLQVSPFSVNSSLFSSSMQSLNCPLM